MKSTLAITIAMIAVIAAVGATTTITTINAFAQSDLSRNPYPGGGSCHDTPSGTVCCPNYQPDYLTNCVHITP
jgi:hypothetical protein